MVKWIGWKPLYSWLQDSVGSLLGKQVTEVARWLLPAQKCMLWLGIVFVVFKLCWKIGYYCRSYIISLISVLLWKQQVFKESVSSGSGNGLLSLLFPRKSHARLGDHRERIVCPHYAQPVHTDKEAVFWKLKLGPQEMSVLRPENLPAVSFSLLENVPLYICKKKKKNGHFFD
jgi:hypothetical protein